jgi:cleavage and polyadenylation specificity factor subunit 2
MMEWLGGTVSKEDVGEEGGGSRVQNKRKRDEDGEEDALGAFALRFKYVTFMPFSNSFLTIDFIDI